MGKLCFLKQYNALKTRHYDQIAFKARKNSLDTTGRAGVFDYVATVYKPEDEELYKPFMPPEQEGKPDKRHTEALKEDARSSLIIHKETPLYQCCATLLSLFWSTAQFQALQIFIRKSQSFQKKKTNIIPVSNTQKKF